MNAFYYCIFGDIDYYRQLMLSIFTLRVYGKYEGDLHIFADQPALIQKALGLLDLSNKVYVHFKTSNRGMFNRYDAGLELLNTNKYSEIAYLDCDIVICKALTLFQNIPKDREIFVKIEKNIPDNLFNFFGKSIGTDSKEMLLINSGMFVIKNSLLSKAALQKTILNRCSQTVKEYDAVGDQPIFVNVLQSFKENIDTDFLDSHETLLKNDLFAYKKNSSVSFLHLNTGHFDRNKFTHLKRIVNTFPTNELSFLKLIRAYGVLNAINFT